MRVETSGITSQVTWYTAKPILGAIMGLFTYFAFFTGLSLLLDTIKIDKLQGVILIGFLGGYLESFSTKILNQLADRLTDSSKKAKTLIQIDSVYINNTTPKINEKIRIKASVSGGKPPYNYSLSFIPNFISTVKDIASLDGSIDKEILIPSTGIETETEFTFKIDITDSDSNTCTYIDASQKFTVKS